MISYRAIHDPWNNLMASVISNDVVNYSCRFSGHSSWFSDEGYRSIAGYCIQTFFSEGYILGVDSNITENTEDVVIFCEFIYNAVRKILNKFISIFAWMCIDCTNNKSFGSLLQLKFQPYGFRATSEIETIDFLKFDSNIDVYSHSACLPFSFGFDMHKVMSIYFDIFTGFINSRC